MGQYYAVSGCAHAYGPGKGIPPSYWRLVITWQEIALEMALALDPMVKMVKMTNEMAIKTRTRTRIRTRILTVLISMR